MSDLDLPQIFLHISALLVLVMLIFIAKTKRKQQIHYFSLILNLLIFIWNISLITEMYSQLLTHYSGMIFTNICFSAVAYVSVFVLFLGLSFSSHVEFKKRNYLFLIFPTISNIMLWTNPLHHLFFVHYSEVSSEIIRGPFSYAQAIYAYLMLLTGIWFLVYFSIKNSGFFSKQSLLIVLGATVPILVDLSFIFQLYSFSLYYEPISFSFAVVCIMYAILKYDFLSIVPIALQTVVDHISDSYIVINENLDIIDFNLTLTNTFRGVSVIKRKMNIWTWLEQIKYLSEDNLRYLLFALNQTTKEHTSNFFEAYFSKNGFNKVFAIEITPVITKDRYKGTIILLKDITELRKSFDLVKQTQAQLIEKEHLITLGQMVGGIAHNLKTPIMSISGGIEGLHDLISEYDESIEDAAVLKKDHHEIAREMDSWIIKMRSYCSYMSDIISTVKGQAVQLTSSTTDKFELSELLKRIEILMNHELKKYGCKLNVVCSIEKSTMIRGEVNSLVQIINNLIINSIESYEGKEGNIDFSISQEDLMLLVSVKDYGSGMTDSIKERLFKEMLTTKAKSGTGLGLYMSYSTIVGKFGGKMWFDSEVGKGTTFFISIPVA